VVAEVHRGAGTTPVHRIDSDIDDHGSALRAGERVHQRIRARSDQRGASVAARGRLVPDS